MGIVAEKTKPGFLFKALKGMSWGISNEEFWKGNLSHGQQKLFENDRQIVIDLFKRVDVSYHR